MDALAYALSNTSANPRDRGPGGTREVRHSKDLDRILALARKPLVVPDLTDELRLPLAEVPEHLRSFRDEEMRLLPVQSLALHEAPLAQGMIGFIRAGDGKSGIALMLPTVLQSRRALVITRSQLLHQMQTHDNPMWSANFRVNLGAITFAAYEMLSDPDKSKHDDFLERLEAQGDRPFDTVIFDEAHLLKDKDAARTKRVLRFASKRPRPRTRWVFMSGSFSTKTPRDYAHMMNLALGEGSPVPLNFMDLKEWCGALDAKRPHELYQPGALMRLCESPLEPVRVAYRRRLMSTMGVVSSVSGLLRTPLYLHERTPPEFPEALKTAITECRRNWVRPDGEELDYILEAHRVLRQLAMGFYYRYMKEEHIPEVWRRWNDAKQAWQRRVREFLTSPRVRPGWDSPKLLADNADKRVCRRQSCKRFDRPEDGEVCGTCGHKVDFRWPCPEWHAWKAVRDTITPRQQTVWLSAALVEDAVLWGKQYPGGCIWYANTAVGLAISQLGGFPLYGPGKKATRDLAKEDGTRTIVASIRSHGEGKNLQHFPLNLVTELPGNIGGWEQLLARSHRRGTKAERVDFWVYRHTKELRQAFDVSLQQGAYLEESLGMEQRLLQAGKSFSDDVKTVADLHVQQALFQAVLAEDENGGEESSAE